MADALPFGKFNNASNWTKGGINTWYNTYNEYAERIYSDSDIFILCFNFLFVIGFILYIFSHW